MKVCRVVCVSGGDGTRQCCLEHATEKFNSLVRSVVGVLIASTSCGKYRIQQYYGLPRPSTISVSVQKLHVTGALLHQVGLQTVAECNDEKCFKTVPDVHPPPNIVFALLCACLCYRTSSCLSFRREGFGEIVSIATECLEYSRKASGTGSSTFTGIAAATQGHLFQQQMATEEQQQLQHPTEVQPDAGHVNDGMDVTKDPQASIVSGRGGGGAADASGKGRKKRAYRKAPDAPTRGRSAYVLYSMAKREEVKAALPPEAK